MDEQRLDRLKALRMRTGAPWWRCAEALDRYGSVDAAADNVSIWRGTYDGDPRHRCTDECPPWPFRWSKTDHRGHACSTHCKQHPDERHQSAHRVALATGLDAAAVEGALSICDWRAAPAIEFLWEAGAPRATA